MRGEAPRGAPNRLDLHDLSLFAGWDPGGRWRLFGEFELGEALVVREGRLRTDQREFDYERLYAEYDLRPDLKLRLGKFLTPVGRWNLIHADPLVWTTRRPLTTELPFAAHASGLSLLGEGAWHGGVFDYQLFVDDSLALDPDRGDRPLAGGAGMGLHDSFDHALGGRLHLLSADARDGLGASLAWFRRRGEAADRLLLGGDWHRRRGRLVLDSEAFYRFGRSADDWGGFLQAVARIHGGLHLVGRYEYIRSADLGAEGGAGLLGLTWRFHRAGVVKLGFQESAGPRVQPDGWILSYGLLY